METDTSSPLFTHPGDLSEPIGWLLPVLFGVGAVAICVIVLVRPRVRPTFVQAGIVFLPLVAFAFGNAVLMERSKTTEFCTSCHLMTPVHESTLADDGSLASTHVSHGIVPASLSCYTCHSGYGLLGDMKAKRAGVNHMLHTISGEYDLPLQMRDTYDIDSCLECHAETKRFREVAPHQVPDLQSSLLSGEMSCTGMCHPAAHPPEALTGPVARAP